MRDPGEININALIPIRCI